MADAWDDMKRAKEDQYFDQQNKEALARLRTRSAPVRPCPVTGEPMEQITLMGVVLDRCKSCGGVWLDKGELETLMKHFKEGDPSHWIHRFFGDLF